MHDKVSLILFLVMLNVCAQAQVSIIPRPVYMETVKGGCRLEDRFMLDVTDKSLQPGADFLDSYLQRYYGLRSQPYATGIGTVVRLRLDKKKVYKAGAYLLACDGNGIEITAGSPEGVFYGVQSLIQLLPTTDASGAPIVKGSPLIVPGVIIQDEPRYAWRGMHLDVTRHFFPVSFVKQYIDFLALHKMNYFHWHLTDDQGWRIEIKKYPRLTSIGANRAGTIIGKYPGTGNDDTPYGGYYTQAQIREIVAYAAKRYITVIPEIEMPGHASAAIAAYPELSCYPDSSTVMVGPVSRKTDKHQRKQVQQTWGVFDDVFCPTEYTFHFMEDVLDEVIALFPARYIHIGGDECPKDAWLGSPFCKSLIRRQGLKDEHALQSYFIRRIEQYLNQRGRYIIGWDEILEGGLAPNATVMSWRGDAGGVEAAMHNHDVVMTPGGYMYFDHAQARKDDSMTIGGYTTVQKVYSFEPLPKAVDPTRAHHILGAQANVWTEYITNPEKVEYQIFPRMSALSEVLWTPSNLLSWPAFEQRLQAQLDRYRLWGVHYSKAMFDPANN